LFGVRKSFLLNQYFLKNTAYLSFLFIEELCDIEDWSNDAENSTYFKPL